MIHDLLILLVRYLIYNQSNVRAYFPEDFNPKLTETHIHSCYSEYVQIYNNILQGLMTLPFNKLDQCLIFYAKAKATEHKN